MFRLIFALSAVFFALPVAAQQLPPPAPLPETTPQILPETTPAPGISPRATPRPSPTPAISQPPLWPDKPIVIGEPVQKRPSVAGIEITGLKDAEAIAKLKMALAPKLKAPIRLIAGEFQYTFLREELGASIPFWPLMRQAREKGSDVPIYFQIEPGAATKALRELDAQVREDQRGLGLNVGGSLVRVKAALEKAPVGSSVELLIFAVTIPTPKPTEKTPEKPVEKVNSDTPKADAPKAEFPYLLASFSTHYDASLRGRTTNLRMAAKNIDGTVVEPGKTFSTNQAIGPRNAEAGWKEAKMFVSGQVVSGTGAGICQAASTLYNVALLADLPIVERHNHMFRVSYVPASRDAAIYWGGKDFRFRNDSDGAIYVQTFVKGGRFHAAIWGEKPGDGDKIRVESQILSRKDGATRSTAYKWVGDKRIRLSSDFYKPHP